MNSFSGQSILVGQRQQIQWGIPVKPSKNVTDGGIIAPSGMLPSAAGGMGRCDPA